MPTDALLETLSDTVLDFTEGKRAIIIGGAWVEEERRTTLEHVFGFHSLEWFAGDKGSEAHTNKAARLIEGGGVDVIFLLVKFMSHGGQHAIKQAIKKRPTRQIIITGFNPSRFAFDIQQQVDRDARSI